jgi:hypothetical protein
MNKRIVLLCAVLWTICAVLLGAMFWHKQQRAQLPDATDASRILELIMQLGAPDWSERLAATEELKRFGQTALPFLLIAKNTRDNEIRPRVRSIARWIVAPSQETEYDSWVGVFLKKLEANGIQPPPAMLGNLQADPPPPPQHAEFPPPLLPLQVPDGLGAMRPGGAGGLRGMNPGAGMLGGMGPIGGLGGLGGLMGGIGGMGGGLLGNMIQMSRQAQAIGIARARAQQGVPAPDNPVRNAPRVDQAQLANATLNLLDSFGVRLSEDKEGLRVTDVRPGSTASKSGIRVGDVLMRADGRQLAKFDDAKETIGAADAKTAKIELLRRGDVLELNVNE